MMDGQQGNDQATTAAGKVIRTQHRRLNKIANMELTVNRRLTERQLLVIQFRRRALLIDHAEVFLFQTVSRTL